MEETKIVRMLMMVWHDCYCGLMLSKGYLHMHTWQCSIQVQHNDVVVRRESSDDYNPEQDDPGNGKKADARILLLWAQFNFRFWAEAMRPLAVERL
jgi:hypothetical protein